MSSSNQVVAIECIQSQMAAELFKEADIQVFNRACGSEQEWLTRVDRCHTMVHFFTDRSIPKSVFKSNYLQKILIAGPAAGCISIPERDESNPVAIYDTPGQAVDSVAEHVLTMLLMLAKQMPNIRQRMQAGDWPNSPNQTLFGSRIGLIGFGQISQVVARQCTQLGAKVVVNASSDKQQAVKAQGYEYVGLEYLLESCDFISIHKRLSQATLNLLDETKLKAIKKGAYLINCSRAELVDNQALLQLLDKQILAGAALDVFEEEPLPQSHSLRNHPSVIATPHNAWLTKASIQNMVDSVIAAVNGDFSRMRRVH